MVRRSTSMPLPLESMPQPTLWVIGTMPSTFGNAASRSGVKCAATNFDTLAEQFTVETTPM